MNTSTQWHLRLSRKMCVASHTTHVYSLHAINPKTISPLYTIHLNRGIILWPETGDKTDIFLFSLSFFFFSSRSQTKENYFVIVKCYCFVHRFAAGIWVLLPIINQRNVYSTSIESWCVPKMDFIKYYYLVFSIHFTITQMRSVHCGALSLDFFFSLFFSSFTRIFCLMDNSVFRLIVSHGLQMAYKDVHTLRNSKWYTKIDDVIQTFS